MLEYQSIAVILLVYFIRQSQQHGYLYWPPQRSSLWRFNFETPPNYNDNALWCGGIAYFTKAGGRCGTCGDPFYGPRENEAGGKYALGIIGARYPEGTKFIQVTVKVNALHKGHFEFKLCPHNNPQEPVKQSCLDQHPLRITEGAADTEHRLYFPQHEGEVNLTLTLPLGMSCSQCVLQWRYRTGNSWGTDEGGKSCLGCGIQEQFQNCADISIGYGMSETLAETNSFHMMGPQEGISKSNPRIPDKNARRRDSYDITSVDNIQNVNTEKKNIDIDLKSLDSKKQSAVNTRSSRRQRKTINRRRKRKKGRNNKNSWERPPVQLSRGQSSTRRSRKRNRRQRTSRRRNASSESQQNRRNRKWGNTRIVPSGQRRRSQNRRRSRLMTRSRSRSGSRSGSRVGTSVSSRRIRIPKVNVGNMVESLMRTNIDRSRSAVARSGRGGGANTLRTFLASISRVLPQMTKVIDPCGADSNRCH